MQNHDQGNQLLCLFNFFLSGRISILLGFFSGNDLGFLENPKNPRKRLIIVLVFLGLD